MRHKTMTLAMGVLLVLASIHAVANHHCNVATNSSVESTNEYIEAVEDDYGWMELGTVSMSAFFDESWHWATATLYKLENSNLAYRVRYEDNYYTVIARMENGETKCSVLIPYQGEKRWFSFTAPCW